MVVVVVGGGRYAAKKQQYYVVVAAACVLGCLVAAVEGLLRAGGLGLGGFVGAPDKDVQGLLVALAAHSQGQQRRQGGPGMYLCTLVVC